MEPRTAICVSCGKEFTITNPRSRQKYCSPTCYPPKRYTPLPEKTCKICGLTFIPTYKVQECCSDECKRKAIGIGHKKHVEPKECLTCGKSFVPKRPWRIYCSNKCSKKRFGNVTKVCEFCNKEFTVAYRFRGQKHCDAKCAGKSLSLKTRDRIKVNCLHCNKEYEITKQYIGVNKYCSAKCFYEHKYNRVSMVVTLTCKNCGIQFERPFIKRHGNFCSPKCANTGIHNGMYGKPSHWRGKHPWHYGLTAKTDERLAKVGQKISEIISAKIVAGDWNHCNGFSCEWYTGIKNGAKSIYLRSSYESTFVNLIETDSTVTEWNYEPFRIPYEFEGIQRYYVPDFIYTANDILCVVEVKPSTLTQKPQNLAKESAARIFCEQIGYKYLIVTEDMLKTYTSFVDLLVALSH
jgi:hypothetical protein